MPVLHRYAFSVVAVVLAALARFALSDLLHGRPFTTFFFAVLLAAVVAGAGPALAATLLSALYALLTSDAPFSSYGINFLSFIVISLAVAALTFVKNRALEESAAARLKLLEAESERITNAAQRDRENFITGVLDSLPHQIAVIDRAGVVLAVNQRWARLASQNNSGPVAVTVGVNYLAVCCASSESGDLDARRALEGLQSVLRGEQSEFVMEYPCHGPDAERWFIMHAASASCEPAAIVITHTDITKRMQTERQLRAATEELTRLDQRKDAFLATLAHELRNPLAPIRTAIPVLKQDVANGWGERDLNLLAIIERQVGNLVRLVDDLIDISRFNKGKITLKMQVVDLADVLRSAIEISKPNIEKGAHTLTTRLPDDAIEVQGDPVRLAQIFSNLLNNAAKYTDHGGEIALEAARDRDEAIISVRDNGQGVSPEMLPRIFDLFAQTDNSISAQGGLGIGLALVKTLVTLHGGSVDAHSAGLGEGSVFTVRLPCASPGAEENPRASDA